MKKSVLAIALVAFTVTAVAGEQRVFTTLDSNQDDQLSKEEFLVHVKDEDKMSQVFDKRDKDQSGFLTEDEYTLKKSK
ncbi:MAG: hypothetical protein V7711_08025 [Pseudomonadales bacterium]